MIYLFYGSDREKVLKESETLIKKLILKDPSSTLEKFDEDTFDRGAVELLANSTSLFGSASLVVIDNGSIYEEFEEIFPSLKNSNHTFVLREGPLTKAKLKPFEKHAEKMENHEKKEGKKESFNVFAFTDAIGERNKKNAWILYTKAIMNGMVPEELFWKVVWQVKTLLLADKTKSAAESGLNPYVFQKAKSNLRKWKKGELEKISEDLVLGYHEARRGGEEIGSVVEKLVLSL